MKKIFEKSMKEITKNKSTRIQDTRITLRKGNKLYVKWKVYDNSFSTWIDKKDVTDRNSIV